MKPMHLFSARCLRAMYDVSWYKIGLLVQSGGIVPYAVSTGTKGNRRFLFHPDQVPEIIRTCANVPKGKTLRARMAQERVS